MKIVLHCNRAKIHTVFVTVQLLVMVITHSTISPDFDFVEIMERKIKRDQISFTEGHKIGYKTVGEKYG